MRGNVDSDKILSLTVFFLLAVVKVNSLLSKSIARMSE